MVSPAGNGLSSVALLVFVLPRSFRFRDYHAGPVFHGTRLSAAALAFLRGGTDMLLSKRLQVPALVAGEPRQVDVARGIGFRFGAHFFKKKSLRQGTNGLKLYMLDPRP